MARSGKVVMHTIFDDVPAEKLAAVRAGLDRLTAREREVFALVAAGLLNKQIALKLGTTERTVKAHRGQMVQKMQADSVADLVRMADKLGIAPAQS